MAVAAWIALLLPAAAVALFALGGRRIPGRAAGAVASLATLGSFAASVVAAGAIAAEVVVVIALRAGDALAGPADVERAFGTPAGVGRLLLSDHLLAFEAASIVLLVAAVGGVLLGTTVPASQRAEGRDR